jgi:hypothetical protein
MTRPCVGASTTTKVCYVTLEPTMLIRHMTALLCLSVFTGSTCMVLSTDMLLYTGGYADPIVHLITADVR